MIKSKLKRNVLEVIKEGIYLNIYQKYVSVVDVDVNTATSNMMYFHELIPQLEGINQLYPNLICTNFDISLVKIGNTMPQFGGKYGHKHWAITNEEHFYNGVITFKKLLDKAIDTKNAINENDDYYEYYVQKCDILCMDGKSKPKNNNRTKLSKSIRHEVFKRDNYKCVECGATKDETTLHIDHIQPVSHGGSDELDNLQTLCQDCNLAKSNRFWKGGN